MVYIRWYRGDAIRDTPPFFIGKLLAPTAYQNRDILIHTRYQKPFFPPEKDIPVFRARRSTVKIFTLLGPQSRFGDKPLEILLGCPQNETAVLKGLILLLLFAYCTLCMLYVRTSFATRNIFGVNFGLVRAFFFF